MEVDGLATQRAMDELGLPEALLMPLEEEEAPTTFLQASIWAEGRTGTNLLVQAPSGPDTTVAFAVLLLKQLLDRGAVSAGGQPWEGCREAGYGRGKSQGRDGYRQPGRPVPQLHALVLTRNRDIASRVVDTIIRLGQSIPRLVVVSLAGGVSYSENIRSLARGCHIAVGTPNRVRYLMKKGALKSSSLRTLVLESADWLIAPVFQEDVAWISGELPECKQVLAFTTTDSSAVKPVVSSMVGVPALKGLGTSQEESTTAARWPSPAQSHSRSVPSAAAAVARAAVAGAASVFKGRSSTSSSNTNRRTSSSSFLPGSSALSPASSASIKTSSKSSRGQKKSSQSEPAAEASKVEVLTAEATEGGVSRCGNDEAEAPKPEAVQADAAKASAALQDGGALTVSAVEDMASSTATATPSPPSSEGSHSGSSLRGLAPALADSAPDSAEDQAKTSTDDGSAPQGSSQSSSTPSPSMSVSSASSTSEINGAEVAAIPKSVSDAVPRRSPITTSRHTLKAGLRSPRSNFSPMFSPTRMQQEEQQAQQQQAVDVSVAFVSSAAGSSVPAHDDDDDSAWPRDNGRGDMGMANGGGAQMFVNDHASLELLSPVTFKKDSAAVGASKKAAMALATLGAAPASESAALTPTMLTSLEKTVDGMSPLSESTTSEEIAGDAADAQAQEAGDQMDAYTKSAAASLMEAWSIPRVLLAALEADGFLVPTPLMASVWTAGRGEYRADLLVHGCPGEETATAYSVPILERVLERYPPSSAAGTLEKGAVEAIVADKPPASPPLELQALVLTRTRDMAGTVAETLIRLGRDIPGLTVATLIGGVAVAENVKSLIGGCHVAVGTPGRVRFLMNKGLLRASTAETLVLDSADWLMAPVFQEDVGWIAGRFPKQKQLLAFSGADPAVIQAGLQELVDSPHMAAIGGFAVSGVASPSSEEGSVTSNGNDANSTTTVGRGNVVTSSPSTHGLEHPPINVEPSIGGSTSAVDELRALARMEHAPTPTPTPTPTPAAAAAAAAVAAVAGAVAAGTSPIAPVPRRRSQPLSSMTEDDNSDAPGAKLPGALGHAFGSPRGPGGSSSASFAARVRLSRENQLYGAWCRHAIGGVGGGLRR